MNSTDANKLKKRRKRRVLILPGENYYDGNWDSYITMDAFAIDYDDFLVIREILLKDEEMFEDEKQVKRKVRNVVTIEDEDEERRVCKLRVEDIQVVGLPASIGQLENLTHLDITNTEIDSLPSSIGKLKNLTHLDITDSEIGSFPPSIGKLQNLTHLLLSGVSIASLPPSIGKLQNLQHLSLYNATDLVKLPEEIGNLENLKTIDLCDTEKLSNLPAEIGNLISLSKLTLHNSGITSLPPSIGKLQNLQYLDISETNALVEIPEDIGNLVNLKKLVLSSSTIALLPCSFKKIQNLAHLRLSEAYPYMYSQTPSIDLEKISTQYLKVLELTDLSWEEIVSLPDSIRMFAGLMHLDLGEIVIPDNLKEKLKDLLLVLPQRCPFLGFLDINKIIRGATKGHEKLLFALTCNRIRFRMQFGTSDKDCIPMMAKMWPLVIYNAPRAFDWYPETRNKGYYGSIDSLTISKTDAIYQLLLNCSESFIRILPYRSQHKGTSDQENGEGTVRAIGSD